MNGDACGGSTTVVPSGSAPVVAPRDWGSAAVPTACGGVGTVCATQPRAGRPLARHESPYLFPASSASSAPTSLPSSVTLCGLAARPDLNDVTVRVQS